MRMQKIQVVTVAAHFLQQAENGQMYVPNDIFNYLKETNLIRSNHYHKYTLVMALVPKSKYLLYCNAQSKI